MGPPRSDLLEHLQGPLVPRPVARRLGDTAPLAPRPVLVIAPLHDPVRDVVGVKSAITSASAVYDLRKAGMQYLVLGPVSDDPKQIDLMAKRVASQFK